jgi:uncharacterized protein YlbG (UPF0298 family)
MKNILVSIPDNKVELFMELLKNLSFVKRIEPVTESEIPHWHKEIIDKGIEAYKNNPESFVDFEDVQNELDIKYGL